MSQEYRCTVEGCTHNGTKKSVSSHLRMATGNGHGEQFEAPDGTDNYAKYYEEITTGNETRESEDGSARDGSDGEPLGKDSDDIQESGAGQPEDNRRTDRSDTTRDGNTAGNGDDKSMGTDEGIGTVVEDDVDKVKPEKDRQEETDDAPELDDDLAETFGLDTDSSDDDDAKPTGSGDEGGVQEVVDDAETEEERERREEKVGELEEATDESGNLVLDEDAVAELLGMPFAQADAASEWDGWELSEQEKKTNARLFVKYCEENDIDVSTGTMLAVSMASTVGGRVVRYKKWKGGIEDDERTTEEVAEEQTPDSDSDDESNDRLQELEDRMQELQTENEQLRAELSDDDDDEEDERTEQERDVFEEIAK